MFRLEYCHDNCCPINFATQGSMLNWKSKCSTRSPRTTVAGAKPDDSEFESVNAPLEPQTWEGSFLCGLLKNQPQVLPVAAAKQLQELSNQRKDTLIRWEHSIGSPEDCLHRLVTNALCQKYLVVSGGRHAAILIFSPFKFSVIFQA